MTEMAIDQRSLAQKAAHLKAEGAADHRPANSDHPDPGLTLIHNEGQAPSGAFDAEGQRPVLERSRKVR